MRGEGAIAIANVSSDSALLKDGERAEAARSGAEGCGPHSRAATRLGRYGPLAAYGHLHGMALATQV